MLHASTQQLIRKLCELTAEGAIAWKEGDAGASIFETEGYIVEVKEEPPGIRLLHSDGRELERADAGDLATPWPAGEGTYASKVALMANHAGRIARGAEKAIAKILSSLSAPPKKPVEPEPEPAALAFDPPATRTPSPEGASAIAAVSATLDAQRPSSPPPYSHGLPEPPAPIAASVETETAIDRVLAIQPAPQTATPIAPEAQAPEPIAAAPPDHRPDPEPEPAAAAPPSLIEAAPEPLHPAAREGEGEYDGEPASETAQTQPAEPVQAEPALLPAAEAAPVPSSPAPAAVESDPEPVAAPAQPALAAPKAAFGSIDGFTRARSAPPAQAAQPAAAPPQAAPPRAEASKVTSTGLLMRGFSARTSQFVEPSAPHDYMRSGAPEPQAKPTPAPPPQPAPIVEKQRASTTPAGADIYKPWA